MSGQDLERVLSGLPDHPRVVVSGNLAMPATLLGLVDAALPTYTLHVLNAQRGLPTRPGVVHETSFVGPGMRDSGTLRYVPARLSLLPELFRTALAPDVVVLHTSLPQDDGTVSLGTEGNVLPAAVEEVRPRGARVRPQATPHMPPRTGARGTEVNGRPAAVEEVRRRGGRVLAQANPHMPYTCGDAVLSLEAVDA